MARFWFVIFALGFAPLMVPGMAGAQCAWDRSDGFAINECTSGDRINIALVGDLLLHGPLQRRAYASDDGFLAIWGAVFPITKVAVSTGHKPFGIMVWQMLFQKISKPLTTLS